MQAAHGLLGIGRVSHRTDDARSADTEGPQLWQVGLVDAANPKNRHGRKRLGHRGNPGRSNDSLRAFDRRDESRAATDVVGAVFNRLSGGIDGRRRGPDEQTVAGDPAGSGYREVVWAEVQAFGAVSQSHECLTRRFKWSWNS